VQVLLLGNRERSAFCLGHCARSVEVTLARDIWTELLGVEARRASFRRRRIRSRDVAEDRTQQKGDENERERADQDARDALERREHGRPPHWPRDACWSIGRATYREAGV